VTHAVTHPATHAVAQLDRDGIAKLIPHSGPMCLLSGLASWDAQQLVCLAANHRDPRHPLRTRSGLLASALIEYAAQAMALHGALIGRAAGQEVRPGYLASVRGTQFHVSTLHDLPTAEPDELRIAVVRQAGDERQILYAFTVHHADRVLAEGRAAVVLNTPIAAP
jgi:predicted hotdog family 3-hydroxylacyl-ACP dehydratase